MKTAQHYLKVKSLKHRLKLLVETPFYRTTLNKSKPCTRRRLLFFVMYVMLIRIWSQGSANCSILPSQMEKKHGLSWENMEHKENAENIANMENINQKTKKTLFFIHSTLFVSSVRSSYSHPDQVVIHPLFQITPVLNTQLSLSEPLQL